jgi:hypothetical protein
MRTTMLREGLIYDALIFFANIPGPCVKLEVIIGVWVGL